MNTKRMGQMDTPHAGTNGHGKLVGLHVAVAVPKKPARVAASDESSERAGLLDKVTAAVEPIRETLSTQVAELKDSATSGVETAKETVGELASSAKEKVEDVTSSAKEKVGAASELVREELGAAKEKVVHSMDVAKEKVSETTSAAKDKVFTLAHDGTEKARDLAYGAKDTATDVGTAIVRTVRKNPIPSALIAIGVGWLAVSLGTEAVRAKRRARRVVATSRPVHKTGRARKMSTLETSGAYDSDQPESTGGVGAKLGDLAHRAGDTITGAAVGAKDKALSLAGDMKDKGHVVSEGAKHLAEEAAEGTKVAFHTAEDKIVSAGRVVKKVIADNPLAVGAATIAVGTAIGLALPHTMKEDGLMGQARDRIVERAESLAHTFIGDRTTDDADIEVESEDDSLEDEEV